MVNLSDDDPEGIMGVAGKRGGITNIGDYTAAQDFLAWGAATALMRS